MADKYRNDRKYFGPLYEEIANGGAAAMLYDILRMDLKDWHPRNDVPKTEALMEQKELSLQPEDQWWFELLKTGLLSGTTDFNPRRARSRDLFDAARDTVPGLRFHSDHLLGKALRKRGCFSCQLDKQAAWQFPPLKEVREAWDKKLPGTTWNDQTEWGEADPF